MSTRIAILWTRWSGYMEACYQELASRLSVETFICLQKEHDSAPFDPNCFSSKPNLLTYEERPNAMALRERLRLFEPNLLLICSWHIPEYRQVAKTFSSSGKSVRVLGMDNQWRGTAKQILGTIAFRTVWRGLYDISMVPGPRQYVFARMLGFPSEAIRLGLYPGDVERFLGVVPLDKQRRWLFIGRDTPEKGLDLLLGAYSQYRSIVADPWPLVIVGAYKGRPDQEGIEYAGFVQPNELASVFARTTTMILPSRFEPHGVVIHEAAAAGLSLLCSEAVGAGDVFIRRGLNGIVFETGSSGALACALVDIHGWSPDRLREASIVSRQLAAQSTPRILASTLVELAQSSQVSRDRR
jgi:glycosyltransferase involved in cell wall biosynthesis